MDGVFGGNESLDLPETAHKAVDVLGEVRAMLAGTGKLLEDKSRPAELSDLKALIYNFQEIGKIAEKEMNAAILSCRLVRDRGGPHGPLNNPMMH